MEENTLRELAPVDSTQKQIKVKKDVRREIINNILRLNVRLRSGLASIGESVGEIAVHFGYNLIEFFSGHFYSSPIKAVEELVANSHDAFARKCVVYVPEHIEGSLVRVWDNWDSCVQDSQGSNSWPVRV